MIVDLLDKLIDRCIQMVKRKEEVDRHLFEDFVNPIQDDFEALHKDYLETFRKYRDMIKATDPAPTTNHPIFDALREDSLFSAGMRAKVHGLMEVPRDPVLGSFMRAISDYFYGIVTSVSDRGWHPKFGTWQSLAAASEPPEVSFSSAGYSNVARVDADYGLRTAFADSSQKEEDKRRGGIELLDELVQEMQIKYARELGEFYKLKATLLTPK